MNFGQIKEEKVWKYRNSTEWSIEQPAQLLNSHQLFPPSIILQAAANLVRSNTKTFQFQGYQILISKSRLKSNLICLNKIITPKWSLINFLLFLNKTWPFTYKLDKIMSIFSFTSKTLLFNHKKHCNKIILKLTGNFCLCLRNENFYKLHFISIHSNLWRKRVRHD